MGSGLVLPVCPGSSVLDEGMVQGTLDVFGERLAETDVCRTPEVLAKEGNS